MAASSNKVELSAVSSIPQEHVEFNWNVQNFQAVVNTAVEKGEKVIAKLSFNLRETLFPPGTPKVKLTWKLEVNRDYGKGMEELDLYLYLQTPLPFRLYAQQIMGVYLDKLFTEFYLSDVTYSLERFTPDKGLGWHDPLMISGPSRLSDLREYLDEEGSLNLKVEADFYVESDGSAEILPIQDERDDETTKTSELESFKTRKTMILDQVASLLGDEVTSDVILSVLRTTEDVEIGTFFCHSAILSGRSPVLRGKLKESTEKKDGKVILKLTEDVTSEVIDIFLTFLYSGKFKEARENEDDVDPTWVVKLPELVHVAHKYEVNDLMDLCDVHLHRVVSRDNVRDILTLANRHNLKRTLPKLQTKFSKDPGLLHSVYRD